MPTCLRTFRLNTYQGWPRDLSDEDLLAKFQDVRTTDKQVDKWAGHAMADWSQAKILKRLRKSLRDKGYNDKRSH